MVTTEFIMNKDAHYEIDIAGRRVTVKPHIHPPHIPVITMDGMSLRYKPKIREAVVSAKTN